MRTCVLTLIFLSLLLNTNLASAVTWSEVAQFPEDFGTAPNVLRERWAGSFTCNQTEWRIVWNYTPISIVDPENVYFNILIYRTNDTTYYMMEMSQQGNTTTSGTWYGNNQTGDFLLKFLVYNVLNSTVIIEQAVESVPEFSPMFQLSLFVAGILVAMIARKEVLPYSRSSAKRTP